MFDYFSNLPNEKKTELFHDVVIAICELLYSGRYYFLHDLGMPNEEMLARGYVTEAEMLAEGAEIQHLKNKDLTLQDILQHMLADDIFLVHSQGGTPIPLDMINRLTISEQRMFSDLMNAHICESRAGEGGTEIVVDGIALERVEELKVVLAAHDNNPEMRM